MSSESRNIIKEFNEGEPFSCAGNAFKMLLSRDVGEFCEVVLEIVEPGVDTPPNAHATFQQIYVIVRGEAKVTIGSETRIVTAPAVALIPKNTNHSLSNVSEDTPVEYLYVSIWPDGIPADEREGGWRQVYKRMIQAYADRGYPAERTRS